MSIKRVLLTALGYECITQIQYNDIMRLRRDESFMACSGDYDDDKDTRERYRVYDTDVIQPLKVKYKRYEKYWHRNSLIDLNKILKVIE